MDDKFILGINFLHSDTSSCIFKNGKLIAAAEEERFSRIKHDSRFPHHALHNCISFLLKNGFLIKHIGYYDDPHLQDVSLCLNQL